MILEEVDSISSPALYEFNLAQKCSTCPQIIVGGRFYIANKKGMYFGTIVCRECGEHLTKLLC